MAVGITEVPLDHATHEPIVDVLPMADGGLWFTGYNDGNRVQNGVWTRSPGGTVSSVDALNDLLNPGELVAGPGGKIWVLSGTEATGGHLTSFDGASATHFDLPGLGNSLAFGADGNLWVAYGAREGKSNAGIYWIRADGALAGAATPGLTSPNSVTGATLGNVWFADGGSKTISRMTTNGELSTFSAGGVARNLETGADGSVWYSTTMADGQAAIGHLTFEGSSVLYPLGKRSVVTSLSPNPDGSVWYTDTGLDVVGKLATNSQITTYPTPTDRSSPRSIEPDGSGGYWFVGDDSRFGRVVMDLAEPSIQLVGRAFKANEGPITGDLVLASFTTADVNATADDFLARVDLGSTISESINGEVRADGPGRFLVLAPRGTEHATGTYLMTVTVLDKKNRNAVGRASTLLGVAQLDTILPVITPMDVTMMAGRSTPVVVAQVFDAYASGSQTVAIDWGDGSVTGASVEDAGPNTVSIGGSHVYATPGIYTVTTTVRDNGKPVVATSTVTVVPASVTPDVIVGESVAQAVTEARSFRQPLVAFRVDGFADLMPGDFTATIDWGDGSAPSPGAVEAVEGGRFQVVGEHTYTSSGMKAAVVTITHEATESSVAVPASVPVDPRPLPDFVPEGRTLSAVQGTSMASVVASFSEFTYLSPSGYTATVAWGDGSETAGLVSSYKGEMVVFASHTYTSPGLFTYLVTVTKTGFAPVTGAGTVTVQASTPVVPPPLPVPPVPPSATVTSARAFSTVRRKTSIVLSFSGTVDPVGAVDLSRYRVTDAGKDGKLGTADDRVVKIKAAKFDASKRQVTLTPKGQFSRKTPFRVAVRGESAMTVAWDRAVSSSRGR